MSQREVTHNHIHILAIALLQLPMLVWLGCASARKLLAGWRRLWLAGGIVEQGDDDTSKRDRWNEAKKHFDSITRLCQLGGGYAYAETGEPNSASMTLYSSN
ncbi:hypothetical protein CFAM422_004653 [Trichoderma lentiforme]|uniref:Uncharacterized protein n=1 Tax=Trichoderma lentiforme TaxID=1567552 RepID=A0A9P4XJ30_9HYPO|nr:hypothetical protein CFAM422_004653 [Trichoderma lentiforme]